MYDQRPNLVLHRIPIHTYLLTRSLVALGQKLEEVSLVKETRNELSMFDELTEWCNLMREPVSSRGGAQSRHRLPTHTAGDSGVPQRLQPQQGQVPDQDTYPRRSGALEQCRQETHQFLQGPQRRARLKRGLAGRASWDARADGPGSRVSTADAARDHLRASTRTR